MTTATFGASGAATTGTTATQVLAAGRPELSGMGIHVQGAPQNGRPTTATLCPLIDEMLTVDVMKQNLRASCGDFALIPKPGQAMVRGGMKPLRLGGQDGVVVSHNINRISRDIHSIRRDPGDNFFLIFQDYGQATMCQDSAQLAMYPGDVALIDSTRPSEFIYSGARTQQISVHLPRDEMKIRFGRRIPGGIAILRQDALGLAMRALLAKMLELGNQESLHLKEAFMGVFGSFLFECSGDGGPLRLDGNERLLTSALQRISTRFKDPAFNAATLADALNVPLRSLQRAFKPLGETPSRRILNTRLCAAHDRLTADAQAEPHISTVAYGCGFNDLSFFYREFRKKYGIAPGHLVNPR